MQRRASRWLATAMCVWTATAEASVAWIGVPDGRSLAYARTATGWTRAAAADLPDVGSNAFVALGDLDGDGDADALIGAAGGRVVAFENAGTAATPAWTRRSGWDGPDDVGTRAAPALGDVDGDGDLDLLVGSSTGAVVAYRNAGGPEAPAWDRHAAWDVAAVGDESRPALGDVDGDGAVDLAVGTSGGLVAMLRGAGDGTFARLASWDPPTVGTRTAPALADLDDDGRADLLVEDGYAKASAFRRTADGWTAGPAAWRLPDPGSGPAGAAIADDGVAAPSSPDGTDVVAALDASPVRGSAPLTVTFDATRARSGSGRALAFAWAFGDGGGADASAVLAAADAGYAAAKRTRDAGRYADAVVAYLDVAATLTPLTSNTATGTVTQAGTAEIDRVARWYLQKIAHDVGGIYLYHALGLGTCAHLALAYQWLLESKAQAEAGGFPDLPRLGGTLDKIATATTKLEGNGCAVPAPAPMFDAAAPATSGAIVEHTYARPGVYIARVTVSDGADTASARVTITVGGLPDAPGGPSDNDADPSEGFGASTPGGAGGTLVRVTEPKEAAVRAAFAKASAGHAIVRFEVAGPIAIRAPLPRLTGPFVTVDGNGATLAGSGFSRTAPIVDVRGHDVIVRNLRVRNGGDNLRAQGSGAYNVVFRHVSSTGAGDDGISVGYGAHDVTIQHCFLAGNTRSIFMKYGATTNVSVHHTWIQKQWIRGPLVSQAVFADLRNVIVEDWTLWGTRFEKAASGNVVASLFALSPAARAAGGKANSALRLVQSGLVYTAGNRFDGVADEGAEGDATAPLDAPPVTTLPVAEMADGVRARAGCLPRDGVDQAYVTLDGGWDVGESSPLRLGP